MTDSSEESISSEPDPKRQELIRDTAPHPEEMIFNSERYECIEPGRWRFVIPTDGWYEDVVHALWMEGYIIRRLRGDEPDGDDGFMTVDVVEEDWHSHSTCPGCGVLNEPEILDDGVRCPDCGVVW